MPPKSLYSCTLTGIEPANSAQGKAVIRYICVAYAFMCMCIKTFLYYKLLKNVVAFVTIQLLYYQLIQKSTVI